MGPQGEIANKPKSMEKNTLKEKEIQRKMTKERNKNRNTFGVLQEEDTEPLLDEEEPPQLLK